MKKGLLVFLILLVSIGAGVYLYLRNHKLEDFEPDIKAKLNKLVVDGSHGLYHLDIEKLETDVINSRITLINARLRPDTSVYARLEKLRLAPNDIFDVTISHLAIDDVVAADLIRNKFINLNSLFINNPVIKVTHKKQPYNLPDEDSAKTIYQQIKNDVAGIKVDSIILNNVDFYYINNTGKKKETRLTNVNLFFTDILLDSSTQYDRDRFLFAKNCLIGLEDYSINTSDSLYRFSIAHLQIETRSRAMRLKSLKFNPRLSVNKFYERIKHQQDRFELNIAEVNFQKVDWWAMLAQESFFLNKISMRNGKIRIYSDKSQPVDSGSKVGKYPHQMLMKLPFPLKIDAISLENFDLSFTELNPKTSQTGTVTFDNIRATISNVTNHPSGKNAMCRITASTTFLKKTPLNASFVFDLANHKKGNFIVTASVGAIQSTALNEITIPLALLKLNSLNLKSLDATMQGDNFSCTGTVKMLYSDLSITALKATDDTLKKRGLISFIANNFILKKDNPLHNQPVRVQTASYKRVANKSFFNLVWKTIFTGAGKTVGYRKK